MTTLLATILALSLPISSHTTSHTIMPSNDLLIGDFSHPQFGGWTATGDAFKHGPATGEQVRRLGITGSPDNAVVTTKFDGDSPTGRLISPPFVLLRNSITFFISGGDYERRTCMNLLIKGKIVKTATGRQSDELRPQTWDVGGFHGQSAQIEIVDEATGDWGHINVDQIIQTDHPTVPPIDKGTLYKETLRPQFHFTARQWTMDRLEPQPRQEGWINDLNGLIYYDHEYHLFAQRWYKCWLHAVSRDLVHWTELEPAFWEQALEKGTQSGTCVVDYKNTSGLGVDPANPPMVAFWANADNRSQNITYSLDHGRTWAFYQGNPIMDYPERDPKVFWYAPANHWVMMIYGDGSYHILTSSDLLHWTDQHNPIPNSYECPDFFELPIDGDEKRKKWVLIQGNGNYSIGTFDGTKFSEETERFACDIGPNFYATQTWANSETGDGKRVQVAWMRGADFPGMPFNQEISFPCELSLKTTSKGLRIHRKPIQAIESLHSGNRTWNNVTLKSGQDLLLQPQGDLYHIKAKVSIPDGCRLSFILRGVHVDVTSKKLTSGTSEGEVADTIHTIEILLDRGSVEAYANDGEISSTRFVLPNEQGISIQAEGGKVQLESLVIYSLKPAWPKTVK